MGAGGVLLPPVGYFEKIQRVTDKYEMLFIADEVICGFGRTGNLWGAQTFGIKPDIFTSAKQLSSAYAPISAVVVNRRVYDVLRQGSDEIGTFAHGFTYSGHPVSAAVALECLKIYEESMWLGACAGLLQGCSRACGTASLTTRWSGRFAASA